MKLEQRPGAMDPAWCPHFLDKLSCPGCYYSVSELGISVCAEAELKRANARTVLLYDSLRALHLEHERLHPNHQCANGFLAKSVLEEEADLVAALTRASR